MSLIIENLISGDTHKFNEEITMVTSQKILSKIMEMKEEISKSILEYSDSDIKHNLLSPEYDPDDDEVRHHMKQPLYWKLHSDKEDNHRVDSDQSRVLQTIGHLNDLGHKVKVERVVNGIRESIEES